jgi:hypothetical protein
VDAILRASGLGGGVSGLAAPAFCLSALLAASAYSVLGWLGADPALMLVLPLTLLLSPLLAYFYLAGLVGKRAALMERFIPDALFQASSMQRGTGFERVIAAIARSGYGPLSEEFTSASRQVRAGAGVLHAIDGIARRSDSLLVRRSIGVLSQAYASGAEMGWAMREAAEDALEALSSSLERKAALSVQRYTVLFGALLVPLILGLIAGTVSGLDFSGMDGFGASAGERAALLSAGIGAAEAYAVMFALLASIFAAMQDGEWKRFALYFALLAPAGLALFAAAKAYSI